ncbi:MAG TPA: VOC family protein [Paraburkholderia sp.]|jgi:catechol 2,3-dioxygenase-like lactoylglutathione lyase family enzyme|uniref:VOC family protein n=1 Tax=Paraburkholderia sp. TaxID=1926495 RepID=UPI002DEAAA6D|nr:VOC family protein [Paraburkholderia sp.]
MQLDHVTLVTPDLEGARRFFCDIAGLENGPRPPFSVGGYWLYSSGLDARPIVHLVEATMPGARPARVAPRFDHVALRVAPGDEWQALLARLVAHDVPYQVADVPLTNERQLFVALAPGVVVEFVTAAR